jgi:hypothetical protein
MWSKPDDALFGVASPPSDCTMLHFWKWAFANLCDDYIKGIFAEWMVGRLLQLEAKPRISWADSDYVTPSGRRIEVKASSFWQSWKLLEADGTPRAVTPIVSEAATKIVFSGLRRRSSESTAPSNANYKSDIYVFCFQHETNPKLWNAFDLSQWEFYAVDVWTLTAHGAPGSVSLTKLRTITGAPAGLSAEDLIAHPLLQDLQKAG